MGEYKQLSQSAGETQGQTGGTSAGYSGNYSAEVWDEVRNSFHTSIMVDTKLKSLSENVGMADWPIKAADETPSKYIDMTLDQLLDAPGIVEKPSRIDLLIDVLKETLAFDDPFGDMVEQVEAASEKEDNILRNVGRLELPMDYPLDLTNLSIETKQFCKAEELQTVGEFLNFSQNMARNIVVGGDFRSFLNSLAHVDEKTIGKALPFRVGSTGFHYPEAIGLIVENLSKEERIALLKRFGGTVSEEDEAGTRSLSNDEVEELETEIQEKIKELDDWYKEERETMKGQLSEGKNLDRHFVLLNDQDKELIASKAVTIALGGEVAAKKGGLFSAFSRMFGKS